MDLYTLLYLKWITNKDLLYSTGNSAPCYLAAWMGGEFGGRMDTCICMAESLPCSPDIIITLLIGYTQHKIKRLKSIHMNQSLVYTCPLPSLMPSHLPSHLPPHEVVTEHWVELPASHSQFPLAIYFTYGNVYVSMLFFMLLYGRGQYNIVKQGSSN